MIIPIITPITSTTHIPVQAVVAEVVATCLATRCTTMRELEQTRAVAKPSLERVQTVPHLAPRPLMLSPIE